MVVRAVFPQPRRHKHWRLPRDAGLSCALGDVGTESTPGGNRRPPNPRSGTGSRKSDAEKNSEVLEAGIKIFEKRGAISLPVAGEKAISTS